MEDQNGVHCVEFATTALQTLSNWLLLALFLWLKRHFHEIFDLWFFSSNIFIRTPDSQVKAFSNLAKIFDFKIGTCVVSGVNDSSDHNNDPQLTFIFFCTNVLDMVLLAFVGTGMIFERYCL
jgi:hypothetical protein